MLGLSGVFACDKKAHLAHLLSHKLHFNISLLLRFWQQSGHGSSFAHLLASTSIANLSNNAPNDIFIYSLFCLPYFLPLLYSRVLLSNARFQLTQRPVTTRVSIHGNDPILQVNRGVPAERVWSCGSHEGVGSTSLGHAHAPLRY